MIIQSRRKFITGLIGLVAAPAVVKASSLMPIKPINPIIDRSNYLGLAPIKIEGKVLSLTMENFRAIVEPGFKDLFDKSYEQYKWETVFRSPKS